MGATEYRNIFSNPALKQEAQVRARELAAKAYANTATRINSLDGARSAVIVVKPNPSPASQDPKVKVG